MDDPEHLVDADLSGAVVRRVNLSGARMRDVDLSGAVVRAADVAGMEIDAPWLFEGGSTLLVNGVDVVPLVDAELDRRFPGRALRTAEDPEGLRAAWAALQRTWDATLERVGAMPPGTVDVQVAGEWSFAQTLRHLVMATDTWLRRAVLGVERPFHPVGQPDDSYAPGGGDASVFSVTDPTWEEVLAARGDRVAMVRDFLADVSAEQLEQERRNPWAPEHPETVLTCLQTILGEEWEHLRFAVRDLDVLSVAPAGD